MEGKLRGVFLRLTWAPEENRENFSALYATYWPRIETSFSYTNWNSTNLFVFMNNFGEVTVSWDSMPRGLVERNQHNRGTCCFHCTQPWHGRRRLSERQTAKFKHLIKEGQKIISYTLPLKEEQRKLPNWNILVRWWMGLKQMVSKNGSQLSGSKKCYMPQTSFVWGKNWDIFTAGISYSFPKIYTLFPKELATVRSLVSDSHIPSLEK
jgi:hypothetical protein